MAVTLLASAVFITLVSLLVVGGLPYLFVRRLASENTQEENPTYDMNTDVSSIATSITFGGISFPSFTSTFDYSLDDFSIDMTFI